VSGSLRESSRRYKREQEKRELHYYYYVPNRKPSFVNAIPGQTINSRGSMDDDSLLPFSAATAANACAGVGELSGGSIIPHLFLSHVDSSLRLLS
jgi:hypothetical protein